MNDKTTDILAERGKTHGKFCDHAEYTQRAKQLQRALQIQKLYPTQQEALDMIAHKIGRITAGNPNVSDHWADIAGYARLVADELEAASVKSE